jgi:hypothetical protein
MELHPHQVAAIEALRLHGKRALWLPVRNGMSKAPELVMHPGAWMPCAREQAVGRTLRRMPPYCLKRGWSVSAYSVIPLDGLAVRFRRTTISNKLEQLFNPIPGPKHDYAYPV